MDKQRAEEILGKLVLPENVVLHFENIFGIWWINDGEVSLDGNYTADELEAIAWVMRNEK